MSDAELDKLVKTVNDYFHPPPKPVSVVDAAEAVAEIKTLRPDLDDRKLAGILGISSSAMTMMNMIAGASVEEKRGIVGHGLTYAYDLLRSEKK